MGDIEPTGARNAPRQAVSAACLKVDIPLSLRRAVKARATVDGTSMGETVTQLLQQAMEVKPSDDQAQAARFRRRLPRSFTTIVRGRAASLSTWIEVLQTALAASVQPALPKPVLTVPRSAPRSTQPSTAVVDIPWDPASESDSGVHQTQRRAV